MWRSGIALRLAVYRPNPCILGFGPGNAMHPVAPSAGDVSYKAPSVADQGASTRLRRAAAKFLRNCEHAHDNSMTDSTRVCETDLLPFRKSRVVYSRQGGPGLRVLIRRLERAYEEVIAPEGGPSAGPSSNGRHLAEIGGSYEGLDQARSS